MVTTSCLINDGNGCVKWTGSCSDLDGINFDRSSTNSNNSYNYIGNEACDGGSANYYGMQGFNELLRTAM